MKTINQIKQPTHFFDSIIGKLIFNFFIAFIASKNIQFTLMFTVTSTVIILILPNIIIEFFDSITGKLILIFLIAFYASTNIQLTLILAVVFTIIIEFLEYKNKNK